MAIVPIWVIVVYLVGMGIVFATHYISHEATMYVDTFSEDADRYKLVINIPLSDMEDKHYIRVKIVRKNFSSYNETENEVQKGERDGRNI